MRASKLEERESEEDVRANEKEATGKVGMNAPATK